MSHPVPVLGTDNEGSMCLASSQLKKVVSYMPEVPTFIADMKVYGEASPRLVSEIHVRSRAEPVWADCITGSLFDKGTGRCLTSSNIRIHGAPVMTAKKMKPSTKTKEIEV